MNRNSPRKQAQCRLIPGYAVRVRVRFRIRWWTVVVSGGGPVCGVARDSRWSALFRVFWVLLLVLKSALAVEISQHSHYVCDVCTLCIGVRVCVCVCWRSVGIVAVQGLMDPVALYKVSVHYSH